MFQFTGLWDLPQSCCYSLVDILTIETGYILTIDMLQIHVREVDSMPVYMYVVIGLFFLAVIVGFLSILL